jgi:hypothetical protein
MCVEQVRSNFVRFWDWKFFLSLFGMLNLRYYLLFAKNCQKVTLPSQILFVSTTFFILGECQYIPLYWNPLILWYSLQKCHHLMRNLFWDVPHFGCITQLEKNKLILMSLNWEGTSLFGAIVHFIITITLGSTLWQLANLW